MEPDGLITKSYPVLLKETLIRPLMRLWGSAQGPNVKLNLESSAFAICVQLAHVQDYQYSARVVIAAAGAPTFVAVLVHPFMNI